MMFVYTWVQGRPLGIGEWIMERRKTTLSQESLTVSALHLDLGFLKISLMQYQWVLSLTKSCWNFMGVASLSFPGDAISQKLFWSSGSSNPCSLFFIMCRRGCVIDVPTEVGYPSYLFSAFWLIVAFCNGLCLLQKELLWWVLRPTLIYGYCI